MGNSIIPLDNNNQNLAAKLDKETIDKEYIPISDKKETLVGSPKIVRSNISGLELEEYIVNNNDSPIDYDIHLYKLRSSSYSKSIVVVYHHKLIDESMKFFLVRTEKMRGRLNEIEGLTLMEGLVLLEAAFGGFSELVSNAKSPFFITERMISINSSNMVRVWLNENYALNKVMQPGKIQNENQMIHQAFTLVQDRVHPEERHPFSEIRFRIGQCPRIVDAKHVIASILLNANRKFILQELVEKQTRKANVSFTNFKIPMNNFHEMHQPHNLNTLSPFNHHIMSPEVEKIRIVPEEYIRDDEGSDRIRLVRQEMKSPSGHIFIGSPLHNNPIVANNRREIFSEPKSNDQRDQRPHSSMMVSPNSKDIYLKEQEKPTIKSNVFVETTSPQNNPNLRLASNEKETTQMEKSPRLRTIFGSQATVAHDKLRSPRGISPIKNVSPLKLKQDQNSSAYNLTNKIALSENKLSQMEKKINKLKEEFSKNKKQKSKEKITEFHSTKPSEKKESIILVNSPLNHSNNQNTEALPIRKDGERGKWETKKSDFIEKSSSAKPNNSQDEVSEAMNQRKSEIFNAGKNNEVLRKSVISENPAHLKEYKVGSNPNFQFRSENNFPSDLSLNSNMQVPTYSRIDENQMSKTSISNFDSDAKSTGERYHMGPQHSQFRLISSPFTLNMNNGYRIVDNKSSIIGRRNNF